ncbi:DNA replication inhibitor plutonium [Stomoxys calcitrans]|uniref:DNA replication inhibitor plutonium n=1 Tax=Stomoxys calcitrans TaxID=35570 RepID=UPI0027E273AD|nr:DNA replication inhibitor plutonium [Stomoxys calcitrans]
MSKINALTCVGQNDICSLRILCTMTRDKKHELEEVDKYGNTALLKACYMGNLEAVITLLQFGANVKAVNHYGQNALTLATFAGNIDIIRELLRYCTYKDFNNSALTPALCVATMHQKWALITLFKELEDHSSEDIQTVHGLNCDDIRALFKPPKPVPQKLHKSMHL